MTSWLLTSTFYGQWLPGDPRGSVTNVLDRRSDDQFSSVRREHSVSGEPYEIAKPGLQRSALQQLKGAAVVLGRPQAERLFEQFQETATYRRWILHAVAIMFNHMHLVVEAPPEIGKEKLLRDFKSYGSRRLNREFGASPSKTWWTDSGSCRPRRDLAAAIFYVCYRQPNPLLVWSREEGRIV